MNERLYQFGQRVKELRNIRKLTQEELAYAAGLDRTYIGGIERGRRNVSLINILKIAGALEVKPSLLLEIFDVNHRP